MESSPDAGEIVVFPMAALVRSAPRASVWPMNGGGLVKIVTSCTGNLRDNRFGGTLVALDSGSKGISAPISANVLKPRARFDKVQVSEDFGSSVADAEHIGTDWTDPQTSRMVHLDPVDHLRSLEQRDGIERSLAAYVRFHRVCGRSSFVENISTSIAMTAFTRAES